MTSSIVQKLWSYCHVLRDDGMSYGDYVEQLTYLLFLKMDEERTQAPYHQASSVPAGYRLGGTGAAGRGRAVRSLPRYPGGPRQREVIARAERRRLDACELTRAGHWLAWRNTSIL